VPDIFNWNLVTTIAVIVAWPLSVPLMALAYKVQFGYKPVPLEPREFWLRSLGGGVGLAALTTVLLGLGYFLVHGAELPIWFAYLVVAAIYIPAGVWLLFWMFACEDLQDALGLYLVVALLAGVSLTPVFLLIRFVLTRHAGS
jgi:hypothetical protein